MCGCKNKDDYVRDLRNKVAELEGIEMFLGKVYVDDTALVSTTIERGWRYAKCEGKLSGVKTGLMRILMLLVM